MRLLLDTHVAVWALTARKLIAAEVLDAIADADNDVFVSVVSIWEIAIKHALTARADGFPFSAGDAVVHFQTVGFSLLPVTVPHVVGVEALPLLHADPFDRMLVAQALAEPLRLVTHDRKVAAYSDSIITW